MIVQLPSTCLVWLQISMSVHNLEDFGVQMVAALTTQEDSAARPAQMECTHPRETHTFA